MNSSPGAKRRLATIALAGGFVISSTTAFAATHSGGVSAQAATTGRSVAAAAAAHAAATPPAGAPPTGKPPTGNPPAGAPPGSSGTSSRQYTGTASYTLSGGTATRANHTYSATATDRSAVLVTNAGTLTLTNPKITTSGKSSSSDSSSFYGLNAGVLAYSAGKVTISGGSVTTRGSGANGLFAYGTGASVSMANGTITATGNFAHGAMASGGGSLRLTNVTIKTSGASSAAVATDRGGGTVTVTGGAMTTSGNRSPSIYSTGTITVSGATITATGAEAAVVEGANSIAVTNTTLKGAKNRGVMLYNSTSGDALAGAATFTMQGGSLAATAGPAFYVTNTKAVITLTGAAKVTTSTGNLVVADSRGTGSGNANPATVTFVADGETLTGNLVADSTSTLTATLQHRTTLKGMISHAALTLDSTSTWHVTANSSLTSLSGAKISGSSITNIVGHGHTVTYDKSLAANKWLGGKTYTLADGGQLVAV